MSDIYILKSALSHALTLLQKKKKKKNTSKAKKLGQTPKCKERAKVEARQGIQLNCCIVGYLGESL